MRFFNKAGLRLKPDETTYYRPDTAHDSLQRRLAIFGLFMIVAFAVLFTRLWFMQIVGGKDYKKKAEGNRIREISIEAPRGRLLDRGGQVIVKNRSALTISVVPAELREDGKVINRLSRLLGMGEKEIKNKITKSQAPNQRAVLIKSDVGPETVTYVREHQREFPGVIAAAKPVREYPFGNLAAPVVGYMGEISAEKLKKQKRKGYLAGDEVGLSGVENVYDQELRGKVGKYRLEVDANGNSIRVISSYEPRAGYNMRMTIDRNLQALVESSLATGVEISKARTDPEGGKKYKSTGGSAVVLDPKTGEVIAMASYPSFDLTQFIGGISDANWKALNDPKSGYPLNNRAIMSELPPGSAFKAVTALGALNENIVNMNSPFDCLHVWNKGPFKQYLKVCWSRHGHIDFFNGIVQSCDTVFYEMGLAFYNRQAAGQGKTLQEYAKEFQMGRATGIDLVGEMNGRVPTPEWKKEFNRKNPQYQVWYPGDTVNMAIGQGDLLATPLQMAYLYAGIANGGKFVRPHVMRLLEDEDGHVAKKTKPETVYELELNPATIAQVTQALTGVVQGKGTAAPTFQGFPVAQIPVAGKTGTSEIVGKQPTAWFVCFAPANDPKFVVAVAIEEGGHGGEAAAPVARRILEGLFGLPAQGEIRPSVGD